MPKLVKRFTQLNKRNAQPESDLLLTVEYNEGDALMVGDKVVKTYATDIKQVQVYDHHSGAFTDITAIMVEHFTEQLESMVDSIEWDEVAAEQEAPAENEA